MAAEPRGRRAAVRGWCTRQLSWVGGGRQGRVAYGMSRYASAVAAKRSSPAPRARSSALVRLVSRLYLAQAGACAAVSLSFGRRNVPSLLLAIAVAVALCWLAAIVRSGSHTAWLIAIAFESGFVAVGLFRYAYAARYLGGTLLAMITLGTLLHPGVARAFADPRDVPDHAGATLAEGAGELEAVS
jgi:hypothetical protein